MGIGVGIVGFQWSHVTTPSFVLYRYRRNCFIEHLRHLPRGQLNRGQLHKGKYQLGRIDLCQIPRGKLQSLWGGGGGGGRAVAAINDSIC